MMAKMLIAPRRAASFTASDLLLSAVVVLAAVLVSASPAAAQSDRTPVTTSYGVVTANNVYVRAGAGDSYYPFGRVQKGDMVKIIGEKHYWARVVTTGPTFEKFFGYVRYPRGKSTHLRLENDGRTARTLGKTGVLAPNMNTDYRPGDSWKQILEVPANSTLRVLETTETERYMVYKIALPPNAVGWISTSFIAPVTAVQFDVWSEAMSRAAAKKTVAPAGALTGAPNGRSNGTPNRMGSGATPRASGDGDTPVLGRDEPIVTPIQSPDDRLIAGAATPAGEQPMREADRVVPEHAATTTSDNSPPGGPATLDVRRGVQPGAMSEETTQDMPAPPFNSSRDETASPPAVRMGPATIVDEYDRSIAPTGSPRERLEALEIAYELLRAEPIQSAEVLPLRHLYLGLAADTEDADDARTVARYSAARAEQLTIWADLQKRRVELSKLRKRVDLSTEETTAVRIAQEAAGTYVAVGRLTASVIYDGRRLPRLFRVQDATTGRTVAYLRPDDGFDLHVMLGQIVGVVGERHYEGSLRLDVVEPRRIDLLTKPTSG